MRIGTIRLEVLPGLREVFDAKGTGAVSLEEKIEKGTTVGDIIRKLAAEHHAFGDMIFDSGTQEVSGYITMVVNDRLLESLNGLDTIVKDGDVIRLFPVIAGG